MRSDGRRSDLLRMNYALPGLKIETWGTPRLWGDHFPISCDERTAGR